MRFNYTKIEVKAWMSIYILNKLMDIIDIPDFISVKPWK